MIGKTKAVNNSVATKVLARGPGDSMMESENMPRIARNKYCPS